MNDVHLDEREFAECMLGTAGERARLHLESCVACRAETSAAKLAVADYRQAVLARTAHDEWFWLRQRHSIRRRLTGIHRRPVLRWAATAAMVLVVCAAAMLTPSPRPVQQASNEAAEELLLQQVQSDLGRGYPLALAPAARIDQERSSVLAAGTNN